MEALKELDTNIIQKVAENRQIDIAHSRKPNKAASKKEVLKRINNAAGETGIKQIISMLKLTELRDVEKPLNIKYKKENNQNYKPVICKRITEVASTQGVEKFLSNYNKKVLNYFCEYLCIKPKSSVTATRELLSNEINLIGLRIFLTGLSTPVLRETTMEVFGEDAYTWSRNVSVEALISGKKPTKKKSTKKSQPIKFSKKKKAIRKGVTYHDIYQHYKVTELREWLKERELVCNGKKSVLVKRILEYLDLSPSERRRSRSPTPKKSKNKRVSKAKKTVKQVEEEKEEESEEEDDDDEEEEELEDMQDEEEEEDEEAIQPAEEEQIEEEQYSESEEMEDDVSEAVDFSKMVVCVTGPLPEHRSKFVKRIAKKGARYSSSITKKVTHLICDDSECSTQKYHLAKTNNIPIISPSIFMN